MNQFIIIGKTTENKLENNYFSVEVTRRLKNQDGGYDTDILKVLAFGEISKGLYEYLCEGMMVGVTGRIEVRDGEMVLIAEKVSFLSREERN